MCPAWSVVGWPDLLPQTGRVCHHPTRLWASPDGGGLPAPSHQGLPATCPLSRRPERRGDFGDLCRWRNSGNSGCLRGDHCRTGLLTLPRHPDPPCVARQFVLCVRVGSEPVARVPGLHRGQGCPLLAAGALNRLFFSRFFRTGATCGHGHHQPGQRRRGNAACSAPSAVPTGRPDRQVPLWEGGRLVPAGRRCELPALPMGAVVPA